MNRGSIQFKVNVLPFDDMNEIPTQSKAEIIKQIVQDFQLLLEETIEEGVGVTCYGPLLLDTIND